MFGNLVRLCFSRGRFIYDVEELGYSIISGQI